MAAKNKDQYAELKKKPVSAAIFMRKTNSKGNRIPPSKLKLEKNRIPVHFNPESLDITFTNSVQKGRGKNAAKVSLTETSVKLSMELIFDTTLKGNDVRTETVKIARMLDPAYKAPKKKKAKKKKIPSIVIFQWGTIWFEGYIDSYKEKLDFFSAEGVPLRATVNLSINQQQRDFKPNELAPFKNAQTDDNIDLQNDEIVFRNASTFDDKGKGGSRNKSVTDTASKFGNPAASRALAAMNGVENMRIPEVGELVIKEGGMPQAPRLNISAKAGIGLQAGATTGLFSGLRGQAGAGVSLSDGAGFSIDMESSFEADLGVSAGSSFGLGGKAEISSNASMTADVGLSADIELGIQFEE